MTFQADSELYLPEQIWRALLSAVRPGMPPALDVVLNRALSKRIDERFDSCVEFAAAVRQRAEARGVAMEGAC